MDRETDIRQAVHDALMATGQFDDVFDAFPDDPTGNAASDLKAAAVQPGSTHWETGFDADPDGAMVYRCRIPLMVIVRNADQDQRDQTASSLMSAVRKAIDGQSLGGLTLAQFTWVRNWSAQKPVPPERKITADLECKYLEEGWANTDEPGTIPPAQSAPWIITSGLGSPGADLITEGY